MQDGEAEQAAVVAQAPIPPMLDQAAPVAVMGLAVGVEERLLTTSATPVQVATAHLVTPSLSLTFNTTMKRIAHISNGYITNVSLATDDAELNPGTMLEAEALAQGLTWAPVATAPIWPNVQSFMAAFTMPEKAAIELSTDATIAALRLELTTWLTEVHPTDPRVIAGLDKLVELGILTSERRSEILATPT